MKVEETGGRGGVGGGGGGVFFFFFKQKTAYEIYQCDWSSDVCSSDLMVNLSLNTSLVFAIGYFELARAGRVVNATTFRIAQTWGLVLLFFFVFTYSITLILRYIENKSKIPGLGTN